MGDRREGSFTNTSKAQGPVPSETPALPWKLIVVTRSLASVSFLIQQRLTATPLGLLSSFIPEASISSFYGFSLLGFYRAITPLFMDSLPSSYSPNTPPPPQRAVGNFQVTNAFAITNCFFIVIKLLNNFIILIIQNVYGLLRSRNLGSPKGQPLIWHL